MFDMRDVTQDVGMCDGQMDNNIPISFFCLTTETINLQSLRNVDVLSTT